MPKQQPPALFNAIRPLPAGVTSLADLERYTNHFAAMTSSAERRTFYLLAAQAIREVMADADLEKLCLNDLVLEYVSDSTQANRVGLECLMAGNDAQFRAMSLHSHLCVQMAYWLADLYARRYRPAQPLPPPPAPSTPAASE